MAVALRNQSLSVLKSDVNQASNNIYSLTVSSNSTNALIVFGNEHYITQYPAGSGSDPGEIISLFQTADNDMDIYFVKNNNKYDYCQFPAGNLGSDETGDPFSGLALHNLLNAIITPHTNVNFFGMGVSGNFGALEQSMLVYPNKLNNVILTMNIDKIPSGANVSTKTLDISSESRFDNASNYIFKGDSDFGTNNETSEDTTIIGNSQIDGSTITTINGYDNVTVQDDLQTELPTLLKTFS